MSRSLFTMGFGSATQEYGIVNQGPQLGLNWSDVGNFFKGVSTPATPAVPAAPVVAPPATILGLPQDTVMIGGAIALALGLLVVLVKSRNSAAPATAPATAKKKK
jgi:hypothetical protein